MSGDFSSIIPCLRAAAKTLNKSTSAALIADTSTLRSNSDPEQCTQASASIAETRFSWIEPICDLWVSHRPAKFYRRRN